MGKSVLIPIPLVRRIVDLLGCWDCSSYDCSIRDERSEILHALDGKLQKLELRDAYAKILAADSEGSRYVARIDYLRQRNYIRGLSSADYDA